MRAIRPHSRLTTIQQIDQMIADSREVSARSTELLKAPKPDSFAGRKTQEPFPQEDPAERRARLIPNPARAPIRV